MRAFGVPFNNRRLGRRAFGNRKPIHQDMSRLKDQAGKSEAHSRETRLTDIQPIYFGGFDQAHSDGERSAFYLAIKRIPLRGGQLLAVV